ncbi:MAG: hypothetical protein IKC79_03615 [Clostridia bacterium]|nr:hypothetical protein [Clostridia bacterium]
MNKDILSRYTEPSAQKHMKMLDKFSPEYLSLSPADKLTLMHLTRAAEWINKAYFRMDNAKSTEFIQLLQSRITEGDSDSQKMLEFYTSMRTPVFTDLNGDEVVLYSLAKDTGWLNFYPADLDFAEFHNILNTMLDLGKIHEVSHILSNRTMVVRDGEFLHAIDYVEYFPEFANCAKELRLAMSCSSDTSFNEFLDYQARALVEINPEYDCMADTLWANLKGNTLDFTLTRESYNDAMTESLFDNSALMQKLHDAGIKPIPKDSLGARVGIRNTDGTQFLLSVQNIADVIGANFPSASTSIRVAEDNDAVLDLDIVTLSGCECVAGRCTIAQVLPNDDKLAVIRGGNRKKVYNRQTRFSPNPPYIQYILAPEFVPLFDISANHYSVICHETTHTFGPQKSLLGKYTSILEEEKADLGALAFLYNLQEAGIFDTLTIQKMITTELVSNFQKTKPKLSQAHAVERVMILNKMLVDNALWLDENNLIHIDFDKVVSSSQDLLSQVVDIQQSGRVDLAEAHINQYFVWGEQFQTIAQIIRTHSPYLVRILDEPLKDYLLTTDAETDINNEIITPTSMQTISGK